MANEKILNTRIQLKYDSLEKWAKANTLLKQGEVAIAYLPPKGTGEAPTAVSEAVLMKVGPGNFNALPWLSALAADVYAWAKESSLTVTKDGTGNVVSGIEWDATANGGKGGIKFTTAAVATAEGLDDLQKDVAAIEKVIADNRDAWAKDDNTTYTFTETADGKGITITPSEGSAKTITFAFLTQTEIEALNYLVAADITTGSANGTIAVEGTDVAVKGLQDAAYATVASLNATAKGYADDVQNSLGDLATEDNITASLVTDFATEVAKVKVANATHTDAAGKVDNALTVKVGGADVVFDGSAAKTANVDSAISAAIGDRTTYTDDEIDALIEDAKKHADDNDANTEYHIVYDSAKKKIQLVAGADATQMEIPTDDFIKDGMISSVEIKDNNLVITWNTDADKTETKIPLTELVDVMTGVDGTTIKVDVSADDKISAEVKAGSITTSHIAPAAGIVKTQLADDVQASLTKADNALQAHQSLEHLATKEALADVIDGTTPVAKATNAGHAETADSADHASTAGHADNADAAIKATQDAAGNVITATYATITSVNDITKDNGTIDNKITAYDTSKNFGDIITRNAAEFATSSQGAKADSALQNAVTSVQLTKQDGEGDLADGTVYIKVTEANNDSNAIVLESSDNSIAIDATASRADFVVNKVDVSKLDQPLKAGSDTEPEVLLIFNCGSASTII